MERAIELGRTGMMEGRGGPFGALIVRGDTILGEGENRVTSLCDPTAHAEVAAIRAACAKLGHHSLAGCEIYSSCEPCPMCLGAVYWARLDRLYFAAGRDDAAEIGFDDAMLYEELRRDLSARKVPTQQSLRAEAVRMMSEWRRLPAGRHY